MKNKRLYNRIILIMSFSVPLDENFTYISMLIDRSGSMINLNTRELAQTATSMLREQCKDDNTVLFDGGTFNHSFSTFANGVNAKDFTITPEMIRPNGMTALKPSIARMIRNTGSNLASMSDRRPGKVIFILLSDGEQTIDKLSNYEPEDEMFQYLDATENLKDYINEHQDVYNWTFMFLGTNFDTITMGETIGIKSSHCMNYDYSSGGAHNVLHSTAQGVSRVMDGTFTGFTKAERDASSNSCKVSFDN